MTTFKPGETYKTRDGREARVYAVDGGGSFSIHGAIKTDFGWESENWRENGSVYTSAPRGQADLMPPKRELWVNIHEWKDGVLTARNHKSKRDAELYEDADIAARTIARIRIEYTEGQFDE